MQPIEFKIHVHEVLFLSAGLTLLSLSLFLFPIILIAKDMMEKLQYRFRRTKINEAATEDVYDGE